MINIAYQEIKEFSLFWETQARRIAKEILIGKYPERFLATDFVQDISIIELAEWLDFVYEENKGLRWIDALRLKINETWYLDNLFTKASSIWSKEDKSKIFTDSKSGLNKNIGIGKEKEQTILIPALRKLISRHLIFEGFVAQYEMLESYNTKPSDFEQLLKHIPESHFIENYLILEPTDVKTLVAIK